jgi:thymidylate synthase (FAD)
MSSITVKINPDVQPTGSDLTCVNAARRSFNTRSEWTPESQCPTDPTTGGKIPPYKRLKDKDKRLIQFLARGMAAEDFERFLLEFPNVCGESESAHDITDYRSLKGLLWQWRNTPTHDTPFNHCFISFEVKAPIFVARQLVKHEYLIMSEFSRRYITDDIEFYEPDYWRKAAPDKKQGSLEEPVDLGEFNSDGDAFSGYFGEGTLAEMVRYHKTDSIEVFNALLKAGVAPEQARKELPQDLMTEWTWSGTLGAFAKMCQLRLHPEAQYEARLVAQQVYEYLKQYYPVSAKALVEGPDV